MSYIIPRGSGLWFPKKRAGVYWQQPECSPQKSMLEKLQMYKRSRHGSEDRQGAVRQSWGDWRLCNPAAEGQVGGAVTSRRMEFRMTQARYALAPDDSPNIISCHSSLIPPNLATQKSESQDGQEHWCYRFVIPAWNPLQRRKRRDCCGWSAHRPWVWEVGSDVTCLN